MIAKNRLLWFVLAVIGIALILLVVNDKSGRTLGVENGDFSQLIWLGLFALVIGAAVARSGRSLGTMGRQLGLWAAIGLGLVAGYQYRYELQDVASRITAGLIPGSPLALGIADGHATVTLDKGASGHFEARIEVNNASVLAIVDTGASATVLTSDDAIAAGINPAALNFTVPVGTANGTTNAAAVPNQTVMLGGIVRKNVTVLIAAPGSLGQSLLGMDFIGSLSGFDVRGDRMILRD